MKQQWGGMKHVPTLAGVAEMATGLALIAGRTASSQGGAPLQLSALDAAHLRAAFQRKQRSPTAPRSTIRSKLDRSLPRPIALQPPAMHPFGSERAALLGFSEGGNMSMLFAATYPHSTTALLLFGGFAKSAWAPDYPWTPRPRSGRTGTGPARAVRCARRPDRV